MAIYMTARWKCRQGADVRVRDALAAFVESIKGSEPGTRLYTALQSADDPNSFMTYFIFEDDEARNFHQSTEWVKRFTDTIYPENADGVEFAEFRLIDSTDV